MVNMDRRSFLQSAPPPRLLQQSPTAAAIAQPAAPKKKMIGIQVGAVSFVDEGTEKVLDEFQQDASSIRFSWRRSPMDVVSPDGKYRVSLCQTMGSRNMTQTLFVAETMLRSILSTIRTRSSKARVRPILATIDVLEAVLPSARKRGIKTICWFEDAFRKDLPNIDQLQEKELSGKNATRFASTIRITGTFFWAWWKIGRDPMTSMALCGARSVKALSRRRSVPVRKVGSPILMR